MEKLYFIDDTHDGQNRIIECHVDKIAKKYIYVSNDNIIRTVDRNTLYEPAQKYGLGRQFFRTEQDAKNHLWAAGNRRAISEAVWVASPTQLKEIMKILHFT